MPEADAPLAAALDLLDAGLPAPAAGAFTTRAGGLSRPPWDGANLGDHVADDADLVRGNRALLAGALGGVPLVLAQQVHGRDVAVVRELPTTATDTRPAVDALITAVPGVALVVLAADCLPVLLADPKAGVVGAAHAGRGGLAAGVLQAALEAMAALGADPGRTSAVLGPAVCSGCYELPEKLADEVGRQVPGSRATTRTGTPSVDLTAGAEAVLRAAGLVDVRRQGGCTVEQPARFFSYRRDGVTGRQGGVVRLVG